MSRARLDPDARPDLVVDSLEAGYGQIRVLRGISLRVAAGERVALIGANGAGKTTLLRCIAGLLRAGAGTVTFGEVNLQRVPAHRLVRLGVVLVPEGRQVFTRQSVHANLMLGARTRRDRLEVAEHLDRVFEVFPVLRARSGSRAGELSGGQQQMLALGRAYMSAPRLLMIDELSLGLAPRVVDEVADMVRSLTEATDVGLLVVEQNAAVAVELTERTYVMRNGAIVGEYKSPALAGDDALMLQYLG